MKQQYAHPTFQQEIEILSEQMDSIELQTLMYLKGFDRKTLKQWYEKGLIDFSVRYR